MVNGFIHHGPMADHGITNIINNIERLIKHFKTIENPIVAFIDKHPSDAKEFLVYPAHCLIDDSQSEWIDELLPYHIDTVFFHKNSTNGFLAPEFQEWFKEQQPFLKYYVVGCVTDICVLQFASTLQAYIHQHQLDSEVIVIEDAVETFDSPSHPRSLYNEMAFTLMKQYGIKILNTEQGINYEK